MAAFYLRIRIKGQITAEERTPIANTTAINADAHRDSPAPREWHQSRKSQINWCLVCSDSNVINILTNPVERRMRTTLALLFVGIALSPGCTWNTWNKDFVTPEEKLSAPKFHLVTLGMSKQEVIDRLGPPDQLVGAKTNNGKTIDTWEYIRVAAVPGPDRIAERYQVSFTDGKLSSYESSGDFKQQVNVR